MMKYYLLCATILIAATGCKKTPEPEPVVVKNQAITLKSFDKKNTELQVNTGQGYVTLELDGLPKGVSNSKTEPANGTTPFATTLSLSSTQAAAGAYTIKICSYKDGNKDSVDWTSVDLTIEPLSNEESTNFFHKITNGAKAGGFIQDSSETRAFAAQPGVEAKDGKLYMKNLILSYTIDPKFTISKISHADARIAIEVNCEAGTITIPQQEVKDTDGKSYTIGGSGKLDYKKESYTIEYNTGSHVMKLKGNIDYEAYFMP